MRVESGDTAVLREPGRSRGLWDVFGHRHLLNLIVRKEIQIRYRGSVFGWLWSYVKPLVQFLVFYVALGVFMQLNKSIDFYAIYILSGITIVTFFNEAFSNGTRSLVDNAALIKKIYLPREMFPAASMLVAMVNSLPQIVVVVAISAFLISALLLGRLMGAEGILWANVVAHALGAGILMIEAARIRASDVAVRDMRSANAEPLLAQKINA